MNHIWVYIYDDWDPPEFSSFLSDSIEQSNHEFYHLFIRMFVCFLREAAQFLHILTVVLDRLLVSEEEGGGAPL